MVLFPWEPPAEGLRAVLRPEPPQDLGGHFLASSPFTWGPWGTGSQAGAACLPQDANWGLYSGFGQETEGSFIKLGKTKFKILRTHFLNP